MNTSTRLHGAAARQPVENIVSRISDNYNDRIKDASARLERAVNDLAATAGDNAAVYVERVAARLKRQAQQGREQLAGDEMPQREPAWLWSDEPRSRKLYRDTRRGKIFGVCAGIARHYGIETWVVRCIAVTALIFLNWVAFVAYLVAAIVLDKNPGGDAPRRQRAAAVDDAPPMERSARLRQRSPARRRADQPTSRQQLRGVGADFDEFERRLQRMEAHVTSGQYELQRELARIGTGTP